MCRSVPQIVVVSTRTTTSVGSWIVASGTSSHALLPGPWYTNAFIGTSVARFLDGDASGGCHARVSEIRTIRGGRRAGGARSTAPDPGHPTGGDRPLGSPSRARSGRRRRRGRRLGLREGDPGGGHGSRRCASRSPAPWRRPGTAPPCAGAALVPKAVCGPTVTVNAFPLAVVTVQVVAVSAVICPGRPVRRAWPPVGRGRAAEPLASLLHPATAAPTTASAPISSSHAAIVRTRCSDQVKTVFGPAEIRGGPRTIVILPARTRCSTGARS